ncbi:MAG: formylmethanofuran--tetrahydromethanopterin N-formyltransferase, partial [Candidatus Thorarchaeota archaeon]
TNERYCPTIRTLVPETEVPRDCNFVMEIVINGLSEDAVRVAMRAAIETVCQYPGILRITAGNFGGTLGKYRIPLHELF